MLKHIGISGKLVYSKYSTSNQSICLKYIQYEQVNNQIGIISLNQTKTKNAFNREIIKEMYNTISAIPNELCVLIIRSLCSGVFAAGADLKERVTMSNEQVDEHVSRMRHVMASIHNLSMPVIAAIDGVALGGGLELALACDIRVAASNATMGLVETRLGIIPGAGGTQLLPRLIGNSAAKLLIFTARRLEAKKALEVHLVDYVCEQNERGDAAFNDALQLALEIAQNAPIAIRMAKRAINQGAHLPLADGLNVEAECYQKIIPTADRLEGLKAFHEKRPPIYKGK